MARQQNNSVMYGTRGLFNKQVVFKKRMGKDYVAGPPTKNPLRIPTDPQKLHHERFRTCTRYAKKLKVDAALRAIYEAGVKPGQTAYNAAFQDAAHAPKVNSINADAYQGLVGDSIKVNATDNFKVDKVVVSIVDADDVLIEDGNAVDGLDGMSWEYVATAPHAALGGTKIKAVATDLAGNTAELVVTL